MKILLVSDTHLCESAPAVIANWEAAAAFAERSGVTLSVHLGDLTLDGINAIDQLEDARRHVAAWPTPMRLVPGNHDVGDNPAEPGRASKSPLHPAWLTRYRALFGPDYWTLDFDDWRIVALDAQLLGSGSVAEEEQWAWLSACVDARRDARYALLIHKPLFDRDADEPTPNQRYVPRLPRRRLLQTLAPVELALVLSGHTHQYRDRVIDGVRHLWIPSTAFVIPDSHQRRAGEKVLGVGMLELVGRDARFDLVVPEGLQRHDVFELGLFIAPAEERS